MEATLSKWGNSIGFRIPSALVDSLKLKAGTKISVTQKNDEIILRSQNDIRTVFEDFYKKPLSKIKKIAAESELDWGEVGDEIF